MKTLEPSPDEIAATVLWEFYNNHQAAEAYCRYIGNSLYVMAAEIIRKKAVHE